MVRSPRTTEGSDTDGDCRRFSQLSAELALGVIEAEQRSWALAHARVCARCGSELRELAIAADLLLEAAPRATPPRPLAPPDLAARVEPGQSSAAEREPERAPASRRGRRRPARWRPRTRVVAIGAMIVAVAAAVATITAGGGPGQPHAPLLAAGRAIGEVALAGRSPVQVQIEVHGLRGVRVVRCAVTLTSGRTLVIGGFTLLGGRASWSGPEPQPPGRVSEVKLISGAGRPVARAVFQ